MAGLLILEPLVDQAWLEAPSVLVEVLQALLRSELSCPRLLLAGRGGDEREQALLESWIGLARSLRQVLPGTAVMTVFEDVSHSGPADLSQWAGWLLGEFGASGARSVLYRNGKRHVSRVRPLEVRATSAKAPLRQGGTYLITGGCGGLGLLFAQHLARHYGAKLVLTGRGALDEARQAHIKVLQALGAEVLYAQADVSELEAMRGVVVEANGRFGTIDGVIHAAGLEAPSSLGEMEIAHFGAVLSSKIAGTLVLDEVLADQALDFVCYFSSSSAVLGDFGAGAYAMGNRFLLAHARTRQARVRRGEAQGRTLAIAWPLWAGGGMQFGSPAQTAFYLQSSGQRALEAGEGLAAFERLLGEGVNGALILAGQPARLHRFLGITGAFEGPEAVLASPVSVQRRAELKGLSLEQCVAWELKEAASQLLKMERAQLDPEENLASFGFDSISLAAFARTLSAQFGLELAPSVFFSHPSLAQLAAHLLEVYRPRLEALYRDDEGLTAAPVPSPSQARAIQERAPILSAPVRSDVPEPIAIIGMSGRFPGARTVEAFWQLLKEGQDVVEEVPLSRFDWRAFYGDPVKAAGQNQRQVAWGATGRRRV